MIEKLGLYIIDKFLDSEFCRELLDVIERSQQIQSPSPKFRTQDTINKEMPTRPKIAFKLSDENLSKKIKYKIKGLRADIEKRFQMDLGSLEEPYYTIWREGNFSLKHVDLLDSDISACENPVRRVAIVIYLNNETEEISDNEYVGGKLTFYGLTKNEIFDNFGYPIKGEAGKLIAFPSTFLHEVTAIIHGKRYVINSGFF